MTGPRDIVDDEGGRYDDPSRRVQLNGTAPPPQSRTGVHEGPTAIEPLRGLVHLAKVAVFGRSAIRALADAPIVYIWADIAIAGIIVVLAGGVGCGKTTLLFLILAARMNVGPPVAVLGRVVTPAPTGRFVVLIEGEHGERSAARILVKSCRLLGVPEESLDRVIIIARKGVRIGSPEWGDIERMVVAGLVSDIALDTIARVAPADANDEREQVAIFSVVAHTVDLAPSEEAKPAVWVAAHKKKEGGDDLDAVSGSAQRTGQADSVLIVRAERRDGKVTSSTVTFAKLREEPDDYPMPVDFVVTKNAVRFGEALREQDDRPLEVRITERLALGARTKNKLGSELGRNAGDLEAALSNLFAARTIATTTVKARGREWKAFKLRDHESSTSTPNSTPDSLFHQTSPDAHPTDSREGGNHAG